MNGYAPRMHSVIHSREGKSRDFRHHLPVSEKILHGMNIARYPQTGYRLKGLDFRKIHIFFLRRGKDRLRQRVLGEFLQSRRENQDFISTLFPEGNNFRYFRLREYI
jgi:hypothetical protein